MLEFKKVIICIKTDKNIIIIGEMTGCKLLICVFLIMLMLQKCCQLARIDFNNDWFFDVDLFRSVDYKNN